jgi:hypothetical protein
MSRERYLLYAPSVEQPSSDEPETFRVILASTDSITPRQPGYPFRRGENRPLLSR